MTNILEGSVGGWLIGAASSVLLLYRNKVMGASGECCFFEKILGKTGASTSVL